MRIEELSPEKFYAIIVEGAELATSDAETIVKRFKTDGINVVVLADNAPSRYWGIWVSHSDTEGGWLRDTNGRYFYYPGPAIAEAHLAEMDQEHCSVKEFTLADVTEVI